MVSFLPDVWLSVGAIGLCVMLVVACLCLLRSRQTVMHQLMLVKTQLIEAETATRFAEAQLDTHQERIIELDNMKAELSKKMTAMQVALAKETVLRQESEKHVRRLVQEHKESNEARKTEFENLANTILERKTQAFSQQSQQSLSATLQPLKEQIFDFKRKIEDSHVRESKQRQSLLDEIGTLKSLNLRMSEEALNLTNALKSDTKTQGNWGEVILERVLEESGLRKGHEYVTQETKTNAEGKRYQPDVIVNLPDKKHIVIDSKVSLVAYERYCNEDDERLKQQYLKAHVASLKQHVEGIAPKHYETLTGVNSLDFILIFVPIEPAYLLAFEREHSLFNDAYHRGIIIVSPTTLLAVMRTVQSLWRHERQNTNAEEIARIAGTLHDTIIRVLESAEDMGKHLERAQDAQEKMLGRLGSGRGNLLKTASRLAELGANTKKQLPQGSEFLEGEEYNDE